MGDTLVLEESTGSEDFELIPEDTILEAKVTKIAKETTKMIDETTGDPVQQYVFTFAILDSPYVEQKRLAWGRTSLKFSTHEKCRLYNWVLEIMAINELQPKFRLDLDNLLGLQCRIVMGVRSWDDKKAKQNDDGTYVATGTTEPPVKSSNYVKEVARSRTARSTAVAQAEEEPF